MTAKPSLLKRFTLAALTVLVVIQVGILLLGSLGEAQITSRLELYQTDLLLHATELQNSPGIGLENANALKAILGDEPIKTALEQYQSVRKTAQSNLQQLQKQLAVLSTTGTNAAPTAPAKQVQASIQEQQASLNQLDIRIGILQVDRQDTAAALKTWGQLKDQLQAQKPENPELQETVETLMGLWSESPRLLPNAEAHIQKSLDGWFRFKALTRLYELQQRSDALPALKSQEEAIAQQSLTKLAIVGTVPLLGSIIGGILLLVLIVQRFLKGQQSLLQKNADVVWEVPWDWETIVQVVILGFFFIGQFIVPLVLKLVQSQVFPFLASSTDGRAKAIYALTYYVTMAIAGLTVLVLSVRSFRPLPSGWFRLASQGSWPFWGIGGYLVALPLMILISLVNQQIWQGQGGSNPLLQIVLEEADPIALAIFFFTAAVAAPIFEETLFRGFLLPSLTRYVPVWGAIALSSLIFAIAHLSLSEVLPLAVLGSVLGIVYTRSRSLLSSMLLHSLWNSATMISLLILGSGAK